jgi:hypothetical protein
MSMYYYEVKDSTTYQTQVDDLYDQKVDISYGDQRSAKLSLGDKPVLDDLPLKNLAAKNLEAKNQIQLELLFDKTSVILSEFQEAAKKEFEEVDLKLEDIQNVLGKLISSALNKKRGSNLVSHFRKASKQNDFETIGHVFDTFANQAERFARVIVSERGEHSNFRLILQANIGGVAGGKKFIAK